MINYYSADFILPVSSPPIPEGIIGVDHEGRITGIYERNAEEIASKPIIKYQGILAPGFINSHCHLELSHLLGKIDRGTGLIPFIESVINLRTFPEEEILAAMEKADQEMQRNGIVAVGDISNNSISKEIKKKSKLYYHTYIEVLCFDPSLARAAFENAITLCEAFGSLSTSLTPHAPYSVCKEFYRLLKVLPDSPKNRLSIHNQESEEENKFFRYKTGGFVDFYNKLHRNIDFFKAQARDSIQTIVPLIPRKQPILFVHNVHTSMRDIFFVDRFDGDVTWCFCPNANLYIGGVLPKLDLFLRQDHPITIGTDSLSSNDRLSILSELITLHRHFPFLKLTESIAWATLNGARFLGIEDRFGSLEPGKKPGLNLIEHTDGLRLTERSTVRPLLKEYT